MIIVFIIYAVISSLFKIKDIPQIEQIIGGISMFLAGAINFFVSKNYYFNSNGDREYYAEEGVFMFIKVQQCDDLECKFAQLSNEEINNYLDNKSDAYSDEVFEMNLDKGLNAAHINNIHAYKDALNDIDDAALNAAITD